MFSISKKKLTYNLISYDLFHLGNTTDFIGVFASCIIALGPNVSL